MTSFVSALFAPPTETPCLAWGPLAFIASLPRFVRLLCILVTTMGLLLFNLVAPGFTFNDISIIVVICGIASMFIITIDHYLTWISPSTPVHPPTRPRALSAASDPTNASADFTDATATGAVLTVEIPVQVNAAAPTAAPAAASSAAGEGNGNSCCGSGRSATESSDFATLRAAADDLKAMAADAAARAESRGVRATMGTVQSLEVLIGPLVQVAVVTAAATVATLLLGAAAAHIRSIDVIAPIGVMGLLSVLSAWAGQAAAAAQKTTPAGKPAGKSIFAINIETMLILVPFAGFSVALVMENIVWGAAGNALAVGLGLLVAVEMP